MSDSYDRSGQVVQTDHDRESSTVYPSEREIFLATPRPYSQYSEMIDERVMATNISSQYTLTALEEVDVYGDYPEGVLDRLIHLFLNTVRISDMVLEVLADSRFVSDICPSYRVKFYTAGRYYTAESDQTWMRSALFESCDSSDSSDDDHDMKSTYCGPFNIFMRSLAFRKFHSELMNQCKNSPNPREIYETAMGNLFTCWDYSVKAPSVFLKKYNSVPSVRPISADNYEELVFTLRHVKRVVEALCFFRSMHIVGSYFMRRDCVSAAEVLKSLRMQAKYARKAVLASPEKKLKYYKILQDDILGRESVLFALDWNESAQIDKFLTTKLTPENFHNQMDAVYKTLLTAGPDKIETKTDVCEVFETNDNELLDMVAPAVPPSTDLTHVEKDGEYYILEFAMDRNIDLPVYNDYVSREVRKLRTAGKDVEDLDPLYLKWYRKHGETIEQILLDRVKRSVKSQSSVSSGKLGKNHKSKNNEQQ